MGTIELKPLSEEVIDEVGFTYKDLWLVKVGEEIYGPFETESLRHYSAENAHLFRNALLSRVNESDYKPFYAHTAFERREARMPVLPTLNEETTFRILVDGQKSGPITKVDLEKKLEMQICAGTDLISLDDGQTWQKIYTIPEFDRRRQSVEDLPLPPEEISFKKIKREERADSLKVSPHTDLTALANLATHKSGAPTLNIEEITLKSVNETEVDRSIKKIIPIAVASCFAIVALGFWMMQPSAPPAELTETSEVIKTKSIAAVPKVNKGITRPAPSVVRTPPPAPVRSVPAARVYQAPERRPARLMPEPAREPEFQRDPEPRVYERSPLTRPVEHESFYPTEVETHNADRQPSSREDEMPLDPIMDEESLDQRRENSLVEPRGRSRSRAPQSLDQQMYPNDNQGYPEGNYDSPAEKPMMEEVSDF